MPIEIKKVDNLPLVIATLTGHVSGEEVEQMYQDTEVLLSDVGDKYYRITDVREADTQFPDFIKMLGSIRQVGKFRTNDPNMKVVFVGNNAWIDNIRTMAQRIGVNMPAFQTMEDAIAYIEIDIAHGTEE